MQKTLSLIYRLSFIIFALWGLLEYSGYAPNPAALLGFTPLVIGICTVCILAVFLFSLKNQPPVILTKIKGVCTLLAVLVLILHLDIALSFFTSGWITGVLLPLMMILDWLFFDKKGSFSARDLLIWLGLLAGLLLLLGSIFKDIPWLQDIVGFLQNPDTLMRLIGGVIAASLLMYILDGLLGGSKLNATLLRFIFLVLEGFCFVKIANASLGRFLSSMQYYSLFINFLCFLCVAVVVMRDLLGKSGKSTGLLPRIKACLGSGMALLPIFFGGYGTTVWDGGIICTLLCIVCPVLIIADCLLFDRKNSYKPYDPLWWLVPAVVHFTFSYFILRPFFRLETYSYLPYSPFAFFGMGILAQVIIGYALFAVNNAKRK